MKRVPAFQAHAGPADFLERMAMLIAEGETAVTERSGPPRAWPIVLIVGAPRSGTTLLTQWLQQVGFAVPTNIAARFYRTPMMAGMIQRLLSDPSLDYRGELQGAATPAFTSDYGKTRGLLQPHEFSWFIRRYFPVNVGEPLGPDERRRCDAIGFTTALRRFADAVERPVAMKGMLLQYALDLLAGDERVLILHSRRDPVDNIVSLLSHRSHVAGDNHEWISVRPPEYDWLKSRSPSEQVAGQVVFTDQAIERQCAPGSGLQRLVVDHEAFCGAPEALHARLSTWLETAGHRPLGAYAGPARFEVTQYPRDGADAQAARQAIEAVRQGPSA